MDTRMWLGVGSILVMIACLIVVSIMDERKDGEW